MSYRHLASRALRACTGMFHPRALTAAPLAALLLAGCIPADEEEHIDETSEELVVCPGPSLVYGVDVSYYQGTINWAQVKTAKDFAIARVSDGSYLDTKFDQNWAGMKAAGIIRGAYQFFEPGQDPTTQANIMIQKMVGFGPGDLPPMLDMEVTGGQSPATITAKIHTWVNKIKAATGRTPLIYTGKYFWEPNVQTNDFASFPLVIAAYVKPNCPNTPSPWTKWAMWQYSSSGSVPGISGNVDMDEFNGTMADLKKLAGMDSDWGAQYVSQSFPLASTPLVMTVNQDIKADMVLKNVGKKAWTTATKLATTQPRDRASVFAGADWLSPSRLAAVKGTVAPGANFKFNFTFHAPEKPGTYFEYFGMVQEGVAWFSAPGQGGPADDVYEAQIKVIAAEFEGKLAQQSFPTLKEPAIQMEVGGTLDGFFDLKNVGTATWKAGVTKLAPTPRDKASVLGGDDWLSETRVSTLDADVAPGAVGHFAVKLTATKEGEVNQTFGLVEEGVTWFQDAPKGGGPPDTALAIHVQVGPPQPTTGVGAGGAGGGEDTGSGGDSGAGVGGGLTGSGDGGGQSSGDAPGSEGSCSVGAAPREGSALPALLGLAVLGLGARRRRTR
jgi:lysozyme